MNSNSFIMLFPGMGGQARCLLRVHDYQEGTEGAFDPSNGSLGIGTIYLLGLGLYSHKEKLLRNALPAGGQFTLSLRFKPDTSQAKIDQCEAAMMALGTMGGLGSRSRKGLGSLSIQSINGGQFCAPETVNALKQTLHTLIAPGKALTRLPPYSAFYKESRLLLCQPSGKPLSLLEKWGKELAYYRVMGEEKNKSRNPYGHEFSDDRDLMKEAINGTAPDRLPRRTVFGLPHNYFFKNENKNAAVNAIDPQQHQSDSRRGSPLFCHIHRFPDRKSCQLALVLKSVFLPEESGFRITSKLVRKEFPASTPVCWGAIDEFFDRFLQKEAITHG